MIATIRGVLVDKSAQGVVVEAAGVGYALKMPTPDLASLPAVGEEVRVFTYMQVKDDAMKLYGFESRRKKDVFIDLIGVNNVGPKAALAILSHMSPEELERAIISEDIALISQTPGIGKKTAQRLVLELKESVRKHAVVGTEGLSTPVVEAREALINLGYAVDEAARALAGVESGQTVDSYIKHALKHLATL